MLLSKLGGDGSIIEKIPPLAASYRITGTTTPVLIGSYTVDDGSYDETGNAVFATDNTTYQLLNVQEVLRISGGRPCRIAVVCEGTTVGSRVALESAMTTLGVS